MSLKYKKVNFTNSPKKPRFLNIDMINSSINNGQLLTTNLVLGENKDVSTSFKLQENANASSGDPKATDELQYFETKHSMIEKNLCSRCESQKTEIVCKFCNDLWLCRQCDKQVHKSGKFSLHLRSVIKHHPASCDTLKSECSDDSDPMAIRFNQIKQIEKNNDIKRTLTNVNIHQVWKQVLKSLERQFDQLMEQMNKKKEEILKRVENKQEKQIQKYQQLTEQYSKLLIENSEHNTSIQSLKRSSLQQKLESIENEILAIQNQYQIDEKCHQNRYTIIGTCFEEIGGRIKNIHLKNVISKRTFDSEIRSPNKTKIKNYLCSNMTNLGSPKYNKTPNQEKSFMTKFNSYDKPNAEQTSENKQDKHVDELKKARSQKTLINLKSIKSPNSTAVGSISSYFRAGNKKNATRKL